MIEVEVKAWLDNETEIEKRLYQIGSKYLKIIEQTDIYFQHPKKDFKNTDEALRIRKEENAFFFTYKGPKINEKTKTREEIEVHFDDWTKLRDILEKLGFKVVYEVRKSRKLLSLNRITISIDKVENLGVFLELEIKVGSKQEVSEATNQILDKIKLLGISENKLERRSYLELLLEKIDD